MIGVAPLISLLVSLIIIGLILYVFWWVLNIIPLPEPLRLIALVIFALIVLMIALNYLLPLAGIRI